VIYLSLQVVCVTVGICLVALGVILVWATHRIYEITQSKRIMLLLALVGTIGVLLIGAGLWLMASPYTFPIRIGNSTITPTNSTTTI